MSIRITLEIPAGTYSDLAKNMENPAELHARVAGDTENYLKEFGRAIARNNHSTAQALGAQPTGHLADAYEAIEAISDSASVAVLVPSASRLRAAFGKYVLTPKNAKFLTIPANREAYGKRAGEFDDLFPMRTGPNKTLVLARRVEGSDNINLRGRTNQRRASRRITQAEVMYVLVAKATIPEDRTLIPFDDLPGVMENSALAFVDDAVDASLQG
jgi:hypothetical protein